jgi:hypothetical protein
VTGAAVHDGLALDLPGGRVPVLLFAGGTTGLLLLAGSQAAREAVASLGQPAEASGLSALAFDGDIPCDAAVAAERAGALLATLGVESVVLVATGEDAAAGLRAAAGEAFAALVLIEPQVAAEELEELLADVTMPKLVLVPGDNAEAQAVAAAAYRHAIGPMVVQHLPGRSALAGETAAITTEATIAFAVGACGDGRWA